MKIIALEQHTIPVLIWSAWTASAGKRDVSLTVSTEAMLDRLSEVGSIVCNHGRG